MGVDRVYFYRHGGNLVLSLLFVLLLQGVVALLGTIKKLGSFV